jgi:succinylglutamic semialdehyde dehydrogenase
VTSTARSSTLKHAPSNLIGGRWAAIPGTDLESTNPANPSVVVWSGSPSVSAVDGAVAAARDALGDWSAWEAERRFAVLRGFADLCKARVDDIADLICAETGKAMWDARGEAGALAAKVEIVLDTSPHAGMGRVTGFDFPINETRLGRAAFRPHGVMAVIGPFNFPAHLPNGHIIPALAMGNTVVLKPSDKAPAVGQLLVELLDEALKAHSAPPGVVNLVQGEAGVAKALIAHRDIDGILFTGSWPVGRKILEANLDHPGRIVALEMGGNSPAIIMPDADLRQAAIECVRSAFISTGQRCTCTRRVIVHESVADRVIPAICKAASNLIVGDPRAEHPVFMGPIISDEAREAVLGAQSWFAGKGGEVLVASSAVDVPGGGWYLLPSVVRVSSFNTGGDDAGCDNEVFGPLLRVSVVDSFDSALEQANATRFGLAASIFTHDQATADRFLRESRAGCVNINTGTAGASSKLPFGGLGLSGNHRPAGSFSLDYCAYPVASMIESGDAATMPRGMQFDDGWLG